MKGVISIILRLMTLDYGAIDMQTELANQEL